VVPLEGSTITPGSPCLAQIVFETPICAIPGDRFIVRDAQATHTLGGGVVLDPFAPSRKRRSPERMRYLHALERMIEGEGLAPLLAEASYGVKQSDLIRLTGQSPERMALPDGVTTVDGARERYVLLSSSWRGLREQAIHALRKFHVESPDEPGPDVGRLRRIALPQLADDLWRALVAELASERTILRSGPWLYLPGHAVTLSEREKTLARKLQPLIAAGRFNPPWVRDLASTLHEPEDSVRHVLRKQVTQGIVYQVVHDLFYDGQCIDELATVAATLAREHGTVEAAQYRDAVGLGRKRAIQILEFFDRVGHTRRMRDSRVLRADSGWRGA
jgi:selenocysteine-specific elongation factor